LYRLRANIIPVSVAFSFLQFGYMPLQTDNIEAFTEYPIVAAMKRDQMIVDLIVDRPGKANLMVKMFIPFGLVEFENVGFHLFFCSSINFMIVFSEVCPTDSQ
jgi:hypothetical protein